jgi:hypothetical protein
MRPPSPSPEPHGDAAQLLHLTRRQIRCIETLPADHEVVSIRGRAPIVRSGDGELMRIRPSGRMVPSVRVERVRSYLHLHG